MDFNQMLPTTVLHWNYRGFTEFPLQKIHGEEKNVTDIYLKENLISEIPNDIGKLVHLESLYLSGNDITELPREIAKLRGLKCLDVSGNRLRRIPDEIGEVSGLKFLILDENELRELPLRIAELRSLRYLSVCDNQLEWLPQRPVFNYHHCELRFWRNQDLKTIPYSLWYHMFRDQQTRSLNIGCLKIPKYHNDSQKNRCRLKLKKESREWDIDINCPSQYTHVLESSKCSPPSLYEISKRALYQLISRTAQKLSETDNFAYSMNSNINSELNMTTLEDNFEEFNINQNGNCDLNGNDLSKSSREEDSVEKFERNKGHCAPADLVKELYNFLPGFIKIDLSNGPVSRCENASCRKPIFDYVIYEFCIGKIILIDNFENVVLSAAFCAKSCADAWKIGKANLIPWTFIHET